MKILLLLCLGLPALGVNVQQRIVDGDNANIANYPHQLSLRENGVHICGASLIGNNRAVTGAQCLGSAIGVYTILGGTADRTAVSCEECVFRDLNFISRHPQYDANGVGIPNDIAVIGFPPVTFTTNLAPINLTTIENGDFVDESCIITGWGEASLGDGLPENLQEASVTVLSNTACESTWGNLRINSEHICFYSEGISACNGDGGGPLVCRRLLAGTLSWGEENCDPAYPYVSSRISGFQQWINEQ